MLLLLLLAAPLLASTPEISIPIGWVISAFGTLCATVAGLAGILWNFAKDRFREQDEVIDGMRKDIERLSSGCGMETCLWRRR